MTEIRASASRRVYEFDERQGLDRGGVHSFSPVRSIYRWRGEVFQHSEGRRPVDVIVSRVKEAHRYEVPGISARPIIGKSGLSSMDYR
jgi:hypothetical protein